VVAAVTVFLLLGRLLEQRATRESGAAVRELLALQSVRARRERADGTVEDVPSDLVLVGDIRQLFEIGDVAQWVADRLTVSVEP
ncbi:MAG: hypothetical protein EBW96_07270, partial [Actinobacteria bacterium]|nr:hypothetical protein [Actinomycetota bacterium]